MQYHVLNTKKIDFFRERKFKKHGYNLVKSGLNIIPARNVKMRWIVKVILRNPKRQKFFYKKWRKATHAATAFRFSGDRKRFGGLGCVKKMGLSRGEVITKGRLPAKIVLQWRSSSTKGPLPPKVVFHRRLSSNEGCLQMKVVFLLVKVEKDKLVFILHIPVISWAYHRYYLPTPQHALWRGGGPFIQGRVRSSQILSSPN